MENKILTPALVLSLNEAKNLSDFESAFNQLYKEGIQNLLKAEMSQFLGYEKSSVEGNNSGNSRNGFSKKKIKTTQGHIDLDIPRDRNGEFEPVIIPKWKTTSDKIESIIISLYAKGMSTQDITSQIEEIYGISVSKTFISNITNTIMPEVSDWQNRLLERTYCFVWLDCIVVKVRNDHKIANKSIYLAIGLKPDGVKEVLGIWISDSESASFWMTVLTEIKNRGVERILIACTDNLNGFTKAINACFPETITQLCIVHQIRNSIKFVGWKDRKDFLSDLKKLYAAVTLDEARGAFEIFKSKWSSKYRYAINSWENNWENLIPYFDFTPEIRKIIYTTNTIESINREIRKFIKTKSVFPTDQSAIKSIFLAIEQIQKKWNRPIQNWGLILNQLLIIFDKDFLIGNQP